MALRIVMTSILLFSVLFMPFWVSGALAIVGMIFFSYYVEATFLLLVSDLLFGMGQARYLDISFVAFLLGMIILVGIEIFKTKSSFFYSKQTI